MRYTSLRAARQAKIDMSVDIETRAFRMDDYDAAIALWSRVEGVEVAEGDTREEIARFVQRNPALSRVATDGSTLVAVALCGHDGRRGYIYHLAVDPASRRRRLGKRLVDECLKGLRAAGLKRVIILVASDNPRGLSFWRNLEWEDIPFAMAMGIDL
jgi:ribosomal protein S18 acetylase RimI-like enzyme